MTATLTFFLTKYEFMVITRQAIKESNADTSLLYGKILSSIDYIDTQKIKKGASAIHITVTPHNKTTLIVTLNKPIDLASKTLTVYLTKSLAPLQMAVTVRDGSFFSNSLHPAICDITQDSDSYIKVPVSLKDAVLQNTNLYRINQITLSFSSTDNDKAQWALIKDITVN